MYNAANLLYKYACTRRTVNSRRYNLDCFILRDSTCICTALRLILNSLLIMESLLERYCKGNSPDRNSKRSADGHIRRKIIERREYSNALRPGANALDI